MRALIRLGVVLCIGLLTVVSARAEENTFPKLNVMKEKVKAVVEKVSPEVGNPEKEAKEAQEVNNNFRSARHRYERLLKDKLGADQSVVERQLSFCQEKEKELEIKLKQKEELLKALPERISQYYESVKDALEKTSNPHFKKTASDLYINYEEVKGQIEKEIARIKADLAAVRERIEQLRPRMELLKIKQDLRGKKTVLVDLATYRKKQNPEEAGEGQAIKSLDKMSQDIMAEKIKKLEKLSSSKATDEVEQYCQKKVFGKKRSRSRQRNRRR